MFERPRKNGCFWLAVAAAGGGVAGFLIVVVSIIVLVALLLALFGHLDLKSAASYGNPSLSLVDASHNWTGQENQAVVNEALYLAAAMYNGPPDGYDTWYHAAMIPDVFSCAACGNWTQGDVQCVAFITAAYALAGQPLPYWKNMNAIDYYTSGDYANAPGWEMVSPYSMPLPGDIVVLNSPYFGRVGHVVLVVDVQPPRDGRPGYVQFAQANGPGSLNQEPLYQDTHGNLHMSIWPNYTIETYLRHVSALTTPRPSA
jgi:hypothetical protein